MKRSGAVRPERHALSCPSKHSISVTVYVFIPLGRIYQKCGLLLDISNFLLIPAYTCVMFACMASCQKRDPTIREEAVAWRCCYSFLLHNRKLGILSIFLAPALYAASAINGRFRLHRNKSPEIDDPSRLIGFWPLRFCLMSVSLSPDISVLRKFSGNNTKFSRT